MGRPACFLRLQRQGVQLSTHCNDRKENRAQRALECVKNIKHSTESGNKEMWAILPIFNFYIHMDLSRVCFY